PFNFVEATFRNLKKDLDSFLEFLGQLNLLKFFLCKAIQPRQSSLWRRRVGSRKRGRCRRTRRKGNGHDRLFSTPLTRTLERSKHLSKNLSQKQVAKILETSTRLFKRLTFVKGNQQTVIMDTVSQTSQLDLQPFHFSVTQLIRVLFFQR